MKALALLIVDLHEADREPPIGGTVWKRQLNESWTLWVNGNTAPCQVGEDSAFELQPGDLYVEAHGFPAISLSMITGEGLVLGWTEEKFRALVLAAIEGGGKAAV